MEDDLAVLGTDLWQKIILASFTKQYLTTHQVVDDVRACVGAPAVAEPHLADIAAGEGARVGVVAVSARKSIKNHAQCTEMTFLTCRNPFHWPTEKAPA